MKEEDLSRIKRYPTVEHLRRKDIRPIHKTPTYAMYHSPFREETHLSFKVDTEKSFWVDYGEDGGGGIIDLCMRTKRYALPEVIRRLGQNAPPDAAYGLLREKLDIDTSSVTLWQPSGTGKLIEVPNTLPSHLETYLTGKRYIDLNRAGPFLKCICYEVGGRRYQAIGSASPSGNYEPRDDKTFKRTIAPKDIIPIFTDRAKSACIFEDFTDFLSFLSMKEEITNHCLMTNSVNDVAKTIRYLSD